MAGVNEIGNLEISVQDYVKSWSDVPHVLIDVREQDEWDEGHIGSASLIPLDSFADQAASLDPAVPVVIICRSGRRSLMAAEYLAEQGFRNPVSIAGGMIAWTEAGHPVAR